MNAQSLTRGDVPFADAPAWLFPCGTRGQSFTHWHTPDGSKRTHRSRVYVGSHHDA